MNSLELDSIGQSCELLLFRNVKNGSEIRGKLMKGQIDATIINAELVPDLFQIYVAANKACLSDSNGKKLTRTIHTEVLYNLSPSKSVTESLKIFGIQDSTNDLIMLVFKPEIIDELKGLVHGENADLAQHQEIINWTKIAHLHGISEDLSHEMICDLAVSKSAAKDLLL